MLVRTQKERGRTTVGKVTVVVFGSVAAGPGGPSQRDHRNSPSLVRSSVTILGHVDAPCIYMGRYTDTPRIYTEIENKVAKVVETGLLRKRTGFRAFRPWFSTQLSYREFTPIFPCIPRGDPNTNILTHGSRFHRSTFSASVS